MHDQDGNHGHQIEDWPYQQLNFIAPEGRNPLVVALAEQKEGAEAVGENEHEE